MAVLTDAGAERAVLAGLFAYGFESYVEISDFISHSTFVDADNQVIYRCIVKVLEDGAELDVPALISAAEKLSLSDSINQKYQLEYIQDLMAYPVNKDNVPFFAAQIKKFEFVRSGVVTTKKIQKDLESASGDESIDEIVSMIETPLIDFLREDESGVKTEKLGDEIDDYLEFLVSNYFTLLMRLTTHKEFRYERQIKSTSYC